LTNASGTSSAATLLYLHTLLMPKLHQAAEDA